MSVQPLIIPTPARHYSIDPDKCIGCVLCMKACPAKAIRCSDGVGRINPALCLDCGVCYRVCPHGAVEVATASLQQALAFPHPIAIAHAALFSQFGYDTSPNQVLSALRQIGFHNVIDLSWVCEMSGVALEEYLINHPEPRPAISPSCPVVVRLIAQRYPSLLPHVAQVVPSRIVAAKTLKTKLADRYGWPQESVGVFVISPCPAKMISPGDPIVMTNPYLDGVISFPELYGPLLKAMRNLEEEQLIHKSSGCGLSWGFSGGQSSAVSVGHTLAVSGFQEVIEVLDLIEAGRMSDFSFVEARVCLDGSLGGPLTVENRYRAKSVLQHLSRRYGSQSAVDRERVKTMMREGIFDFEIPLSPEPAPPLAASPLEAIGKVQAIQEILSRLPRMECGVCGSPDCDTFVHDVVQGMAVETACPFIKGRREEAGPGKEGGEMTVEELVDKLGLEVAAGRAGLDRVVQGGYVSDLLSDVMANAPTGALWITIQTHQNVPAVAVLRDLAAVCLAGGRQPQEETLQKAEEEGMPILLSKETSYNLAGKLYALGPESGD